MSLRKLNQFHSPLADVRVTIYRDATDTALVMFTEAVDKKCGN